MGTFGIGLVAVPFGISLVAVPFDLTAATFGFDFVFGFEGTKAFGFPLLFATVAVALAYSLVGATSLVVGFGLVFSAGDREVAEVSTMSAAMMLERRAIKKRVQPAMRERQRVLLLCALLEGRECCCSVSIGK
ncbi:hypothetical protein GW17_00055119 [Ensete ventricosum]|nr:hypothetical protein GW17_00055119 [Ensete ventricosum]